MKSFILTKAEQLVHISHLLAQLFSKCLHDRILPVGLGEAVSWNQESGYKSLSTNDHGLTKVTVLQNPMDIENRWKWGSMKGLVVCLFVTIIITTLKEES